MSTLVRSCLRSQSVIITLSVAWLMVMTLYPVFCGLPATTSLSSPHTHTAYSLPSREDESAKLRQWNDMVSDLSVLRNRVAQLQSEIETARSALPTAEDVSVTVERRVVETVMQPLQCPPPPQYELDEETKTRLEEISLHQDSVAERFQEIESAVQELVSRPEPVVYCESVEAASKQVLEDVLRVHGELDQWGQDVMSLVAQWEERETSSSRALHDVVTPLVLRVDRAEQRVRESEEDARETQREMSAFREAYELHSSAVERARDAERERYQALYALYGALEETHAALRDEIQRDRETETERNSEDCLSLSRSLSLVRDETRRALDERLSLWKRETERALRDEFQEKTRHAVASASAEAVRDYVQHNKEVCCTKTYSTSLPSPIDDLHNNTEFNRETPDFALLTTGTRVVRSETSATFVPVQYRAGDVLKQVLTGTGLETLVPERDGQRLLDSLGIDYGVGDVNEPLRRETDKGRCWAMKGSSGNYTIRLFQPLHVKSISLFHLPWEDSPNVGSALKNFEVHAAEDNTKHWHSLGLGVYNALQGGLQTFSMDSDVPVRFVRLEILDNHGKREYTCLYRFAVHDE